MKKNLFALTTALVLVSAVLLSGCSADKKIKQYEDKGFFANSYENAIAQTDIAGLVNAHFAEVGAVKKKAMLVLVDGMRVDGLDYIMDSNLSLSTIAKDGGLYWTKPANIDTKAKIDVGVNFLSIVTGQEPSSFDVLKSTDSKRATPASIMDSLSYKHSVKFLTDNANYVDVQLASEFKANASQKLSWSTCENLNALREASVDSLEDSDFVAVATSELVNLAKGKFSLGNKDYLAGMINLGYNITDIYSAVKARENEDWLFLVATTCGGQNNLTINKEVGNILTFMFSNKKISIK